jgi:hypothetical protein
LRALHAVCLRPLQQKMELAKKFSSGEISRGRGEIKALKNAEKARESHVGNLGVSRWESSS